MAAKKTGTSLTLWDAELAAAAKEQVAHEVVGGSYKSIGTRGGQFTIDDNPIKGDEINVVVLATAFENAFYDGPFDPNEIKQPVCFALSLSGENMAPHENSTDLQHTSCEGCPNNEFGSADTGRGKACKNARRLMVVTEDAIENAEAFEEAEVRMLKLPPTSGKNWAKYVHRIAEEMQRPAYGVVTKMSIVKDAKTQFKILFEFVTLIRFDQKLMEVTKAKLAELSKEIILPYTPPEDEPERKPARKVVKPAARKVAIKRGIGPARRPSKF